MTKTQDTNTSRQSGFKGWWGRVTTQLGRIGKSLLFPIAVLPIAAILLRLGAQIPGDTKFAAFISTLFMQGGNVVFGNLPILFAVGVGFGLSKDNRGEAALVAFIGMALLKLLMSGDAADLTTKIYGKNVVDFHDIFGGKYDAILADNVLNGFVAGGLTAFIYNRWNGVELPSALGFFSGRRLVPVLTILLMIAFGIFYAVVFPWVGWALYKFSHALGDAQGNRWANASIMFVYGILNRLLLPFGMHHIPNTLFWFTLGEGKDAMGNTVNGDILIFLNGVAEGNKAGTFQSGFFPIMMFGLPALVGAFYVTAEDKEQKRRVLGLFGSAALISFLSGITEPIEFAFLFISPALFGLHAVLTGIFGFITGVFGIQLGFGFSAGLIDFLLSIPKSMDIIHANKSGFDAAMANPAWIFVIGAAAAAVYFFLPMFLIKHFNMNTPGRGTGRLEGADEALSTEVSGGGLSPKAEAIVLGFGGWGNITSYQNCATRLRYDVRDASKIDEALLKRGGAIGVMKVSKTHVQAIIGPKVEILNNEISSNIGVELKSVPTKKAPAKKAPAKKAPAKKAAAKK